MFVEPRGGEVNIYLILTLTPGKKVNKYVFNYAIFSISLISQAPKEYPCKLHILKERGTSIKRS